MKTRLPSPLFEELALIAKHNRDLLVALGSELSAMPTQMYPFESVGDAVRRVLSASPVTNSDGEDIKEDLSHSLSKILYSVAGSYSEPSELLRATIQTIERDYPTFSAPIIEFVRALLNAKQLLLSFKATALREDNENILLESKVVVDIRPIFDVDRGSEVVAHTFLNRLKIRHRTASIVETKIYTLGLEQVDELLQTLERAKSKILSLKRCVGEGALGVHLEHKK